MWGSTAFALAMFVVGCWVGMMIMAFLRGAATPPPKRLDRTERPSKRRLLFNRT